MTYPGQHTFPGPYLFPMSATGAASTDGVLSAVLLSDNTTVRLFVNWSVFGLDPADELPAIRTVSVYRAGSAAGLLTAGADGSAAVAVRGLANETSPGGYAVGVDHEAPFGGAAYYQAFAYDLAGTRLYTSAVVQIAIPQPPPGTWLKSLKYPAMSVSMLTATEPDWSADIDGGSIWPIGRPAPVTVQGVRRYETGTIELHAALPVDSLNLQSLLQLPGPYLLQMPGHGEPDRYVTVGQYARKRQFAKAALPERTWSLPLTTVARPDTYGWSVTVPGRSFGDTAAVDPTFANRTGPFLNRLIDPVINPNPLIPSTALHPSPALYPH